MSLQGARDDPGFLVGWYFCLFPIIFFQFSFPNLFIGSFRGSFQLGWVLTVWIVHCGFLSGAAEAVSVGQGFDTFSPCHEVLLTLVWALCLTCFLSHNWSFSLVDGSRSSLSFFDVFNLLIFYCFVIIIQFSATLGNCGYLSSFLQICHAVLASSGAVRTSFWPRKTIIIICSSIMVNCWIISLV